MGGARRRLVFPLLLSLPFPARQPAGPDVTPAQGVVAARWLGARDSWPRGRGRCRHEPFLGSVRVWREVWKGEAGHGSGAPGDRGGGRGGGREVVTRPREARPLALGQAPVAGPLAPAKLAAALRAVPPRTVPSAGSVPPLLPGQDKGSLTRWDRAS